MFNFNSQPHWNRQQPADNRLREDDRRVHDLHDDHPPPRDHRAHLRRAPQAQDGRPRRDVRWPQDSALLAPRWLELFRHRYFVHSEMWYHIILPPWWLGLLRQTYLVNIVIVFPSRLCLYSASWVWRFQARPASSQVKTFRKWQKVKEENKDTIASIWNLLVNTKRMRKVLNISILK